MNRSYFSNFFIFLVILFGQNNLTQSNKFREVKFKIVDGQEAKICKFPFQVSLAFDGQHSCGGVIANSRFIITAAHCVVDIETGKTKPANRLTVRVGLSKLGDAGKKGKTYEVQKVIPNILFDMKTFENDIAILKLSKAIRFSKKVKPACLDFLEDERSELIASGYGTVTTKVVAADDDTEEDPEVLKASKLGNSLKYALFKENRDDIKCQTNGFNFICIEALSPKSDDAVCFGDSGGPLSIPNTKMVIGVSSNTAPKFDSEAQTDTYCIGEARYTRFSRQKSFIDSVIGRFKYCSTSRWYNFLNLLSQIF